MFNIYKKNDKLCIFFIPCNGYVGLFFCTWQTSTLFIWGLFNLNSLLYITIVFRVFLLVLTRVAHPKLCFAQKPLLYPNRAQINEENKQPNISKKRGYKINHCIFCFTCVFSFKLTSFCISDFRISSSKYPNSQLKDKSQASSKEGWRL